MKVQIVLIPSDEGFAVCAPSLPGCWSQGTTHAEAIENIRTAISEYLEAEQEPPGGAAAAVPAIPGGMPSLSAEAELREVEIAD